MQDSNTNPDKKSLSDLIKGTDGKILLVEDGYDISKHIDLIAKMQAKHEVIIVRIGDLLTEDVKIVQDLISAEKKPNPFNGGIAEMLQESMDKLLRDMKRMELEIPPLLEKTEPKPTKIHDFGHRKQEKTFNNFKPLPKKVLGFRGRR